ncbi:MAG: Asp-tRNA(Asn)/Glu-tRNA(Gln) amidotransferase subunit GatB [Candidatus Kaiserbacteria bacterium]|nr:MAG: Asp-tRNA(Asn)/Glu-tRNA(Gln) amidotransferase subunit GatB [Candidatus Kaiserbacteria bacterium]
MSEYEATIGLEIHAELRTATKMFCTSKNDPDEKKPNVNICPVCLAHPGSLPVINREAVKHVLKVGLALGGRLADYTEFDRKNYFYPDLPKGYQLSQYEYPLVSGGALLGVPITRVHLEEDTASSIHSDDEGTTTIDFNRSGVPLMELVTEPEIHSAEDASAFAKELQLLLRYLGASEANMEKGEMRVEANVSVGKKGELGTKVEIKNLNSFKIMEKAVAYEIERQKKTLQSGEQVRQETRGWDEGKQQTFAQRTKEGSADYRYFPDPDLPSLQISEIGDFRADALAAELPVLPSVRREGYLQMGLKPDDAQLFTAEGALGDFFDAVARELPKDRRLTAANYIANDLVSVLRDIQKRDSDYSADIPISAHSLAKIVDMAGQGALSSRGAKDLISAVAREGIDGDLEAVAKDRSLLQISDSKGLEASVKSVLEANPSVVADFKSGKQAALQFLIGQGMRATKGAADPALLKKMIFEAIS